MSSSEIHIELHRVISSQILENDAVYRLLLSNFPKQCARLNEGDCSLSELLELQKFVDMQRHVKRNNVLIAMRLAGGMSSFCRRVNFDIRDTESLLKKGEFGSIIDAQCTLLQLDASWFEHGRVYFDDNRIAQIRAQNLATIQPSISNFTHLIAELKADLSPIESHLINVFEGKVSPHASRICRLLEEKLSLDNGVLDLRSAKFIAQLSS
ncbi:hypothetical protein [Vibrio sp. Hal054]|uniref:hypothetical protein n=1 Tax=Vibrio sp. Hal054 TaxID=3035158 RepID=UPI00301CEB02